MRQEPKAGRRIVSRGAYAVFKVKKAGLNAGIASGCGFAFLFLCVAVISLFAFFTAMLAVVIEFLSKGSVSAGRREDFLSCLMYLVLFGVSAFVMGKIAEKSIEKSVKTEDVVPLTRANTADLPANDSLVRASQEPAQAQEGVLLRAAAGEASEQHEEQLLRAAAGEQA